MKNKKSTNQSYKIVYGPLRLVPVCNRSWTERKSYEYIWSNMYEVVTDIKIYLINKIFNVIIVGFEFWWRRFLKILWTVKKTNKWLMKQNREFSLNTQMIKLKWSL